MRFVFVPVIVAVAVGIRLVIRYRRASSHKASPERSDRPAPVREGLSDRPPLLGDIGLVAGREIRERVRGRVFRTATVVILLFVAAAIVIPTLRNGPPAPQRIGVVGGLSPSTGAALAAAGHALGTDVHVVDEPSLVRAEDNLRSGGLDIVIVDGRRLVVNEPVESTDTSNTAKLVRTLSAVLGTEQAYQAAGLTPAQAEQLARARPAHVTSLQPASANKIRATSIIGVILVFVMLTQYLTWTLVGVMEEKASRVVEVLLAALRPIQLLGGKVLGIGLVAMGQAAVIVAFALILAKAVGSDLLHGTAPAAVAASLLWLVLGYAFYCWVYAAAGSTAERQEQIQSLAFPLSLPLLVGYIAALTAASSANPSLFIRVLAYLPPTAPFAMPVLVGMGAVPWWGFVASAVLTVLSTVIVARFAAAVYRRSILRTGQRVGIREILA